MNLASVTDEIVAGEVRAWMGRRHRSARSIALELGWTEIYLSRRLTGKVPFNVPQLSAIAELLDVPVSVFFEPPQLAGGLRRARISALGPNTHSWSGTSGVPGARTDVRPGLGLAA